MTGGVGNGAQEPLVVPPREDHFFHRALEEFEEVVRRLGSLGDAC